jgi:NAD(P)H dehydrogenase (quinone)
MSATTFAVMGASGNTGKVVARELLKHHAQTVRVIARNPDGVKDLVAQGAQFYKADVRDVDALKQAFQGVDAVYVMNPPNYMVEDMIDEAKANIAAIKEALKSTGVKKIVLLSSIGAQKSSGLGNILTVRIFESELRTLPMDVNIVRPTWFMENWGSVAPVAKKDGVLPSLLGPLDKPYEMVATEDIGRVCAEVLLSSEKSQRIELAGPEAISPHSVAKDFTAVLGKEIMAVPVPKADVPKVFSMFPPKVTALWDEMVDGFNTGNLVFEGKDWKLVRGKISMKEVVKKLCA